MLVPECETVLLLVVRACFSTTVDSFVVGSFKVKAADRILSVWTVCPTAATSISKLRMANLLMSHFYSWELFNFLSINTACALCELLTVFSQTQQDMWGWHLKTEVSHLGWIVLKRKIWIRMGGDHPGLLMWLKYEQFTTSNRIHIEITVIDCNHPPQFVRICWLISLYVGFKTNIFLVHLQMEVKWNWKWN